MTDLQANLIVMAACYLYIIIVIAVAGFLKKGTLSPKSSRKFLHAMIGNLPLVMPYFTNSIFPFLVASPFILVTFLVTPYSPFPWLAEKLKGLSEITEEGHHTGLIFYAISYSILAYYFGSRPYIVAAGIFPMAYGDSIAALIGMRYGRTRIGAKTLEGSLGMFLACMISLFIGMAYFSTFYGFKVLDQLLPVLLVSLVCTVIEFISPKGLDNIAVPIIGALTFLYAGGGA